MRLPLDNEAVDQMLPGRATDVLVAMVAGWVALPHDGIVEVHAPDGRLWHVECPQNGTEADLAWCDQVDLPHFSTDPNAAPKAFERLNPESVTCRGGDQFTCEVNIGDGRSVVAAGPTSALAASRAALKTAILLG